MADKAHRLTDEKLEEMEKRLSAIYSRAEKEIQKTADEYFARFAKQDEAKRKLVEQGKLGSIGAGAFSGCSSLETVIIRKVGTSATPLPVTNAFTNTPIASGTGYIYVPASAVDAFKVAKNWATYAAQIRAIEDYPGI